MDKSQTVIYWAGALFNHKEVIGNLMVANSVENVSDGRYIVKLPQDFQTSPSATAFSPPLSDSDDSYQPSCK